jgi:Holliday junction DNA helicase RuvA
MALAYIEGIVKNQSENKLILLTSTGQGFEIFCSKAFLVGEKLSLYLTAIYRENSQELFGFQTFEEKLFYELLLSVKGIGPKSGFALLNNLGSSQVQNAILRSDKKLLQSAPGIGAKAAAQIVLDLGNKIQDWITSHNTLTSTLVSGEPIEPGLNSIVEEALIACKELGFKEAKVRPLISEMVSTQNFVKAEDIVESVLRNI